MAFPCNNMQELLQLLRTNGDQILDASSKLALSATLLYKINESLSHIIKQKQMFASNFHVVDTNNYDLEFIYDFLQKTIALKMLPDPLFWNNERLLDIKIFKNLRLLEIQRLSLNLITGLQSLRTQLEYLTCIRSLGALSDVLENCGADNAQGYEWCELKEAVFSYNSLNTLDTSLEFAPQLHTLDLSHNYIQNAQLLNCLPNLKHVNLSYNQLETVPSLMSLEILILRNNFIESVRELSVLMNLRELDLSNNCLLEHHVLTPLSHLPKLNLLSIVGNPLSFHKQHRLNTVRYLHCNAAVCKFILDGVALNRAERSAIGHMCTISRALRFHLDSVCSNLSEITVIPARFYDTGVSSSSDMNSSINSITTVKTELRSTVIQDIGMQDSGIVAERRPSSPSELSIGSADSINYGDGEENPGYDSDIEVLSNPSQSSIEVIANGSGNINIKCDRSTLTSDTDILKLNLPHRIDNVCL